MRIVALAGIATLLLGGCAPTPLTRADVDGAGACDPDVIGQVERQARRTFTQVYWHNCPKPKQRAI